MRHWCYITIQNAEKVGQMPQPNCILSKQFSSEVDFFLHTLPNQTQKG